MWLVILLSIVSINHTQINEDFLELRKRHLSGNVAQKFTADLDDKSARLLVGKKIKKPYRVELVYDSENGINLWVRDTDPFYERLLASYATYVNTMMFPLLNTIAYTRLQKKFDIVNTNKVYQLSFKKGDMSIQYLFDEGELGLVDEIQYFEEGKKIYVLHLNWELINKKYVPSSVRSISYLKTRQAVSFKIENIQLK